MVSFIENNVEFTGKVNISCSSFKRSCYSRDFMFIRKSHVVNNPHIRPEFLRPIPKRISLLYNKKSTKVATDNASKKPTSIKVSYAVTNFLSKRAGESNLAPTPNNISTAPNPNSLPVQANPVVSQAAPFGAETRGLSSNKNRNRVVVVRPLVPVLHRNHVSSIDIPAAGVAPCQNWVQLRKPLMIGCWNVTTLLDPGAQALTMRTLSNYRVDISCLSEVRLRGSGSKCIKVPGKDENYWLYFSGPEDNSGNGGVAVALSTKANQSMISWNPVSPRIAVMQLSAKPSNFTIISVYAPTLPAEASAKDLFYDQLQDTVSQVPNGDLLIIAGDWNARPGKADDNNRHIIGKFSIGKRCENGDRLLRFGDRNDLFVASTRFRHPKKHLLTWYSRDNRTASQIDHVLVRSRWASAVEDCRAYRGAETGNANGSDHMLVRARIKIHLTSRRKRKAPERINTEALNCKETLEKLKDDICVGLKSVEDESSTVINRWHGFKTTIKKAVSQHLGVTQAKKNDWISEDTIKLADNAREARLNNATNLKTL